MNDWFSKILKSWRKLFSQRHDNWMIIFAWDCWLFNLNNLPSQQNIKLKRYTIYWYNKKLYILYGQDTTVAHLIRRKEGNKIFIRTKNIPADFPWAYLQTVKNFAVFFVFVVHPPENDGMCPTGLYIFYIQRLVDHHLVTPEILNKRKKIYFKSIEMVTLYVVDV